MIFGLVLCLIALVPAVAHAQTIKVTLLGTGAPPPVMNRFGPSTLVEAGGQKFVFDAGRGALQRLTQQRVRWQDIDGVFLTHLHSDHVVGFPEMWLTGWLTGAGRDRPLNVWGPRGTARMMSHLEQAYEFDIRLRLYDDRASPEGVVILAEDIKEGVVFDNGGVKVTAFEVDHKPIKPAFGYRIDLRGYPRVGEPDPSCAERRPPDPRSGGAGDVPAGRGPPGTSQGGDRASRHSGTSRRGLRQDRAKTRSVFTHRPT